MHSATELFALIPVFPNLMVLPCLRRCSNICIYYLVCSGSQRNVQKLDNKNLWPFCLCTERSFFETFCLPVPPVNAGKCELRHTDLRSITCTRKVRPFVKRSTLFHRGHLARSVVFLDQRMRGTKMNSRNHCQSDSFCLKSFKMKCENL